MTVGRRVFGLATLAFGIVVLVRHDAKSWDQAAALALIAGGTAMQFSPAAKAGAAVAGAVYLILTAACVPAIVAHPRVYNTWGNFFEQLSLLTGAALVVAGFSARSVATAARIGRIVVGFCAVSFGLEQAFYLEATARLVPPWIPPSQIFWAVATTAAFALAAVALLTNQRSLLASRLLAAMIALFGLLVWVPLLFANPRSLASWSETAETFAIAGTAWILAELLGGDAPQA